MKAKLTLEQYLYVSLLIEQGQIKKARKKLKKYTTKNEK
jgi:hypothetical protein